MKDEGFKVTLHHLSTDARFAGSAHGTHELAGVSIHKLQQLLEALASVPDVGDPSSGPELRIETPKSRFVVRPRDGRLRLHSWTTRVGGLDLSVAEVLATVTGEVSAHSGSHHGPAAASSPGHAPRASSKRKVALLASLILGVNLVTGWMLVKPPPSLLPAYELMSPDKAQRLFAEVAGEYETGGEAGDRALEIGRDGRVRLKEYGPLRAVLGESTRLFHGATANGRPALVIPGQALIEVRDPGTLILFGDTYRRRTP